MPSSFRSGRPSRFGNNTAPKPSNITCSSFRDGSLGGLSRRLRVSSDSTRSSRNCATSASIPQSYVPCKWVVSFMTQYHWHRKDLRIELNLNNVHRNQATQRQWFYRHFRLAWQHV